MTTISRPGVRGQNQEAAWVPDSISKPAVDKDLLAESITRDFEIIVHPLRTLSAPNRPITTIVPMSGTKHLPNVRSAKKFVSGLLSSEHEVAFDPVDDGSPWNYGDLTVYAESGIPLGEVFFNLHRGGIQGFESTIVSPKLAMRLAQRGVNYEKFAGKRRQYAVGYEHEQLCCTHPSLIEEEIGELSKASDRYLSQLEQLGTFDHKELEGFKATVLSRFKESGSRFYDEAIFEQYSAYELLVYLGCSEVQRLVAHIHPSIERVGRTSEELQAVFALRAGVDPLFISGPLNRATKDGYERGIIQAVTAIPMLRAVAHKLGISPDEVPEIFTVGDLYTRMSTSKVAGTIYRNPVLKHWNNHNVFPQKKVMDAYYTLLHQEMLGLFDSFTIEGLLNDPHSLHLAAQLINKGRYISEYVN